MDYRRPQKNQQQLLLRRHWTTSVDINRNTPVYQLFCASQAAEGNVNTLLYHSFREQRELNLTWYKTWSEIMKASISAHPGLAMNPTQAANEHLKRTFIYHWEVELRKQPKMDFYSGVKQEFGEERYLNLPKRSHRVNIAKLRSSSHDLRVELGRYTKET